MTHPAAGIPRSSEINLTAVNWALNDMVSFGHGVAHGAISEAFLDETETQIEGLQIHRWLPDEELRGKGHRASVYFEPRGLFESAVLSSRPVPILRAMGAVIEPVVQNFGERRAVPLLANWTCNKAVVNRIPGTPEEPGEIKYHKDPGRFSGALMVVSFEDAEVEIDGEDQSISVHRGTLEAFAGKDLTDFLGIESQSGYSLTTNVKRFSTAFVNDTAPPLNIKTIFRSGKRVANDLLNRYNIPFRFSE